MHNKETYRYSLSLLYTAVKRWLFGGKTLVST